jgi:hypothetical protein
MLLAFGPEVQLGQGTGPKLNSGAEGVNSGAEGVNSGAEGVN